MAAILWTIVWAVIVIVVLVLAVLAAPVRLALAAQTAPPRISVRLGLLGDLVPRITVHDTARRRPKRPPGKPEPEPEPQTGGKPKPRRRRKRRAPRLIALRPRHLVDLVRPIHVRRLEVEADLGLGDPALTGQLFGLVYALSNVLAGRLPGSIAIRPDFTAARASGALFAEIGFVPLTFVPPGLRLVWTLFGPRR